MQCDRLCFVCVVGVDEGQTLKLSSQKGTVFVRIAVSVLLVLVSLILMNHFYDGGVSRLR